MSNQTSPPRWLLFARAFVHIVSLLCALILSVYWGTVWLPQPPRLVVAISTVLHLLFWPAVLILVVSLLVRSRLGVLASGLALALLALAYAPLFLPRFQDVRPGRVSGPTIKVMTFNTLYSQERPEPVIEQIDAYSPDLVGLQEFFWPKSEAVATALKDRYPYQDWGHPYGLLSRYPLSNCQFQAFEKPPYISRWVQHCDVDMDGHWLTIYLVHLCPPDLVLPGRSEVHSLGEYGLNTSRRDADLQNVLQVIDSRPGPYLVLGDFNMGDMEPAHRRLPAQWTDSFWEAGKGLGLSFQNSSLPFMTWRIDYVFHTPEMVTLSAQNGWFNGSDHRPVIVELGFK